MPSAYDRSGPGSSSAPPLPADPNLGLTIGPVLVRGGFGFFVSVSLDLSLGVVPRFVERLLSELDDFRFMTALRHV